MSATVDLANTNLSYYTVPAAFMLIMWPHAYANITAGRNYDLAYPRKTIEHCSKDTNMDKTVLRRITRAQAAASNGFETLGLYAASVVAANASHVSSGTLNKLSFAYLASRLVYNYVYVYVQDNSRIAPLRSLAWLFGIGIITSLFGLAGKSVNDGSWL